MRKAIPHALLGLLTVGSALAVGLPLLQSKGSLRTVTLPVQGCKFTDYGTGSSNTASYVEPTIASFKATVPSDAVGKIAAYQIPHSPYVAVGSLGACQSGFITSYPMSAVSSVSMLELQITGSDGTAGQAYNFVRAVAGSSNVYQCTFWAAAAPTTCAGAGSKTPTLSVVSRHGATINSIATVAPGKTEKLQVSLVLKPSQWQHDPLDPNATTLAVTCATNHGTWTATQTDVCRAAEMVGETESRLG